MRRGRPLPEYPQSAENQPAVSKIQINPATVTKRYAQLTTKYMGAPLVKLLPVTVILVMC
jgi:hypothetical protein